MPKEQRNAAMIILVNTDGHILMQHRTDDAPLYPGYWAFFGGGLEVGEVPEDGIKREMLEETCYQLDNPKQIFTVDYDNEWNYGKKYYFIEKYDYNQKIDQKEGQGYEWISLNNLSKYKIAEHNLKVIEQIKPKIEAYKM